MRMNPDEKIAGRYLRAQGFDPVHEPNGKQPPDFSISVTTGIEVRRLNESHSDGNESHGLENVAINLPKMITSIFEEFDSQDSQNGYWVDLEYRRPIESADDPKRWRRQTASTRWNGRGG